MIWFNAYYERDDLKQQIKVLGVDTLTGMYAVTTYEPNSAGVYWTVDTHLWCTNAITDFINGAVLVD